MRPNGVAPSTSRYRVGAKGGKVALAWQHVWDRLNSTDFKEGVALAQEAARTQDLKTDSVLAHLSRMAQEGILDREVRSVAVEVERKGETFTSHRKRTFYRIAR